MSGRVTLTAREINALTSAMERRDGCLPIVAKTPARLCERGLFKVVQHASLGPCWQITADGRAAVSAGPPP